MFTFYKKMVMMGIVSYQQTMEQGGAADDIQDKVMSDTEVAGKVKELKKMFDDIKNDSATERGLKKEDILKKWLGQDLDIDGKATDGIIDKQVKELFDQMEAMNTSEDEVKLEVAGLLDDMKREMSIIIPDVGNDKMSKILDTQKGLIEGLDDTRVEEFKARKAEEAEDQEVKEALDTAKTRADLAEQNAEIANRKTQVATETIGNQMSELAELRTQLETMTSEMETATSNHENSVDANERLEASLRDKDEALRNLQTAYNSYKQETGERNSEFETQIQNAQGVINQLHSKTQELSNTNEKLSQSNKELAKKLEDQARKEGETRLSIVRKYNTRYRTNEEIYSQDANLKAMFENKTSHKDHKTTWEEMAQFDAMLDAFDKKQAANTIDGLNQDLSDAQGQASEYRKAYNESEGRNEALTAQNDARINALIEAEGSFAQFEIDGEKRNVKIFKEGEKVFVELDTPAFDNNIGDHLTRTEVETIDGKYTMEAAQKAKDIAVNKYMERVKKSHPGFVESFKKDIKEVVPTIEGAIKGDEDEVVEEKTEEKELPKVEQKEEKEEVKKEKKGFWDFLKGKKEKLPENQKQYGEAIKNVVSGRDSTQDIKEVDLGDEKVQAELAMEGDILTLKLDVSTGISTLEESTRVIVEKENGEYTDTMIEEAIMNSIDAYKVAKVKADAAENDPSFLESMKEDAGKVVDKVGELGDKIGESLSGEDEEKVKDETKNTVEKEKSINDDIEKVELFEGPLGEKIEDKLHEITIGNRSGLNRVATVTLGEEEMPVTLENKDGNLHLNLDVPGFFNKDISQKIAKSGTEIDTDALEAKVNELVTQYKQEKIFNSDDVFNQ